MTSTKNQPLAVFWDLQGTLGGDGLGHVLDFAPFPRTAEALRLIHAANLHSIMITNQSQIAAGKLTLG